MKGFLIYIALMGSFAGFIVMNPHPEQKGCHSTCACPQCTCKTCACVTPTDK